MNKKEYYKCFSLNLKRFIAVHGIRHISKGIHPETNKVFFIYEMTPELSEILTTWTNNKDALGTK